MSTKLHTLVVETDLYNLAYQYMYRETNSAPPLESFQARFREADLSDVVAHIEECLSSLQSGGLHGAEDQLQRLGSQLCDIVVPPDLQRRLEAATTNAGLALYLSPKLLWIPWELVWDGSEFWCQKFCVSRRVTGPNKVLDAAERRVAEERSGRGALILFGDTGGIHSDSEESLIEKALSAVYGTEVWLFADQSSLRAVEELKRDYEVCHFIGHGVCDADGSSGWRFANGSVLKCADIEAVLATESFPLMIFANACYSAGTRSINSAAQHVSSLYQAFLKQGVPHYIGAITQVPDIPAGQFAGIFYDSIARGRSIGEALLNARRRLYKKCSYPVWASYVHYGDPTHKLTASTHFSRGPTLLGDYAPSGYASESRPFASCVCVGRDPELNKAREHFAMLEQGRSGVLIISGETGTGKTTLLNRLLSEAESGLKEAVIVVGRGNQRLTLTEPYGILKQVVHSVLGSKLGVNMAGNMVTVGEWMLSEIVTSFPQLAAVFRPDLALGKVFYDDFCGALDVSPQATLALSGDARQTDIVGQLVLLFSRLSKSIPLVIAVDDAQWIDDSSAAFLVCLSQALATGNGLVVVAYRSESRYNATGSPQRYLVEDLRRNGGIPLPLDFSASSPGGKSRREVFVSAYLDQTYPGHNFPSWFVRKLDTHTGGNALFLAEVLRYASEKGHISRSDRSWTLSADAEDFALPDSISVIIQQRIGELNDGLREMLTCASVEGEHFTAQVLAQLKGIDEEEVLGQLLDSLQKRHQIIEERGEHEVTPDKLLSLFNFRNNLVRQHLYEDLSAIQKRRLHKKVGECLEVLYGEKRFEIAAQLSAHFRFAREWRKSFDYAVRAARQSASIYANREAIRLYRVALELWELLTDKDAASKSALLFESAETLKATARYDEAMDAYRRVIQVEGCPAPIRGRALNGIGDIHRVHGDFELSLHKYQECERIAVDKNDSLLCVEVWTDLAELFWWKSCDCRTRGLTPEAGVMRQKSSEQVEKVVLQGTLLQAWDNVRRAQVVLGNQFLNSGDYPRASEKYKEATILAERYDLDRLSINNVGEISRFRGQFEDAQKYYGQYLDWALRTGATRQEIIARVNLGLTFLGRHEYESARDCFDKVLELNNPRRHARASLFALAGKGITFYFQGAPQTAEGIYRDALASTELNADEQSGLAIKEKLAKVLFGLGEWQLAGELLRQCFAEAIGDREDIQAMLQRCVTTS